MEENKFHEMLFRRHSIRKYTDEQLTPDEVKMILEAALLSPTSKNSRPWHFTVVDNPELLKQLSVFKPLYAHSIGNGPLSVVVSANPQLSDVWIEDASVAATFIMLQVEALGLGCCWIQVRGRMRDEETSCSDWIKDLLEIEPEQEVLCVISIGHKNEERKPVDPEKLKWEKVSIKS